MGRQRPKGKQGGAGNEATVSGRSPFFCYFVVRESRHFVALGGARPEERGGLGPDLDRRTLLLLLLPMLLLLMLLRLRLPGDRKA